MGVLWAEDGAEPEKTWWPYRRQVMRVDGASGKAKGADIGISVGMREGSG